MDVGHCIELHLWLSVPLKVDGEAAIRVAQYSRAPHVGQHEMPIPADIVAGKCSGGEVTLGFSYPSCQLNSNCVVKTSVRLRI